VLASELADDLDLATGEEPEWMPSAAIPRDTGPLGPDFARARSLAEARDRAKSARRAKQEQKRGPQNEAKVEGGGTLNEGGDGSPKPSLTHDPSRANYLKRGKQLLERYKRENGLKLRDDDVNPMDFVRWLMALRPTLSASSWRVYRLSAAAIIGTFPHGELETAVGILSGVSRIETKARKVYKPTLERENSSLSERAKRMEYRHFEKICSSLRKMSRSAAVEWLEDWLVAGISTGLLPGEWPLAHIEGPTDKKVWLHVLNAEATVGGKGSYRTLDISHFHDDTMGAVRRMVERSEDWARKGTTIKRQSDCAQLLYTICKIQFPTMESTYSLFSLRDQFMFNMNEMMDPAQVAALTGSLDVEPQVEHYTKRRHAWAQTQIGDFPIPIDEQVNLAQKALTELEERKGFRQLRKAFVERRAKSAADRKKSNAATTGSGDRST
jgi:hypothetical protein